jgi:hypothetical protein
VHAFTAPEVGRCGQGIAQPSQAGAAHRITDLAKHGPTGRISGAQGGPFHARLCPAVEFVEPAGEITGFEGGSQWH